MIIYVKSATGSTIPTTGSTIPTIGSTTSSTEEPTFSEIEKKIKEDVKEASTELKIDLSTDLTNATDVSYNNKAAFFIFIIICLLLVIGSCGLMTNKVRVVSEVDGDKNNRILFSIFICVHANFFLLTWVYILQCASLIKSSGWWFFFVLGFVAFACYIGVFIASIISFFGQNSNKNLFRFFLCPNFCLFVTSYLCLYDNKGFTVAITTGLILFFVTFIVQVIFLHLHEAIEQDTLFMLRVDTKNNQKKQLVQEGK